MLARFQAFYPPIFHKFCLIVLSLWLALFLARTNQAFARDEVTLLIPASPEIMAPKQSKDKKENPKEQGKNPPKAPSPSLAEKEPKAPPKAANPKNQQDKAPAEKEAPAINAETDLLITRMQAFANLGLAMDMPQALAVLLFNEHSPTKDGHLQPKRRNLLGDVEEILYKGQRAWGANVGLTSPGLYQFILETRPYWDEARARFEQHYVKVMVPVYGEDVGWSEACGQRLEIVPLTRPFGLLAPCAFTAKVLLEGRPLADQNISLQRINTDGQKVPTSLHESLVFKTDSQGQFTAVLNRAGWWACQATLQGAPLKGADGQTKPLQLGSLFWFYVDSETSRSR